MTVLDVGCGAYPHPKATVNVDLFPDSRDHCRTRWNPQKVKNFVLADAHYLPFPNNIFTHVFCLHALEHFMEPLKALKEIHRVCNGTVLFSTPSQFCIGRSKTHLYAWNAVTLKNLLELVFAEVEVGYTDCRELLGRNNRLAKWLPFLNTLLSKFGLYPELYATCKG